MMHSLRVIVSGLFFSVILSGCLGLSQLQTYDDKAGYAAILISRINTTVVQRYEAGAITKDEGRKAVNILDSAQRYLEVANQAYELGNIRQAEDSIDYTIVILTELEKGLGK